MNYFCAYFLILICPYIILFILCTGEIIMTPVEYNNFTPLIVADYTITPTAILLRLIYVSMYVSGNQSSNGMKIIANTVSFVSLVIAIVLTVVFEAERIIVLYNFLLGMMMLHEWLMVKRCPIVPMIFTEPIFTEQKQTYIVCQHNIYRQHNVPVNNGVVIHEIKTKECFICMENKIEFYRPLCTHEVCVECYKKWNVSCPVCRKNYR